MHPFIVVTMPDGARPRRIERNPAPAIQQCALAKPLPQFKTATLASCGKLAMAECSPAGPRLNVTAPGAAFSVDLAIADAIILR